MFLGPTTRDRKAKHLSSEITLSFLFSRSSSWWMFGQCYMVLQNERSMCGLCTSCMFLFHILTSTAWSHTIHAGHFILASPRSCGSYALGCYQVNSGPKCHEPVATKSPRAFVPIHQCCHPKGHVSSPHSSWLLDNVIFGKNVGVPPLWSFICVPPPDHLLTSIDISCLHWRLLKHKKSYCWLGESSDERIGVCHVIINRLVA